MDAQEHDQLPLDLDGASLLDGPFTPAMARAAGLSRWGLQRLLDQGGMRRLLRGVYLASTVSETTAVRARAVGLLVPGEAVVVDRTAAWVHGIAVPGTATGAMPPVEFVMPGAGRRGTGARRRLQPRDVVLLDRVAVTTALRTTVDLGRALAPDRAQGVVDAFLRTGLGSHRELLAELPRFGRHGGIVALRHVVALADARALDAAESALRFHWFAARLPTPVPGVVVEGTGLRLTLGLRVQRFGVCVGSPEEDRVAAAQAVGWRIVSLSHERVLGGDPDLLMRHVEAEFHQQLLRDVS